VTAPAAAVVVCTYGRPASLPAVLGALSVQTVRDRIEVVVVDDGSPQPVDEELVRAHGACLVRHAANRGLAAARNTGVSATSAPIVAFTDDDCIPGPGWVEALLSGFDDPGTVGVGGPVRVAGGARLLERYYQDNEPVRALEADLGERPSLAHRIRLYALANLGAARPTGRRRVFSLPGANFAFRRRALDDVGGFDAGIRFGGEDEDLCHRLRSAGADGLVLVPEAVVVHEYDPRLRDALRRARAYGAGGARNVVKHPGWHPTLYPGPVLWLALWLVARWRPRAAGLALVAPLAVAPRWLVAALRRRSIEPLVYAHIQLLQEAASDVGFASAWWRLRRDPPSRSAP